MPDFVTVQAENFCEVDSGRPDSIGSASANKPPYSKRRSDIYDINYDFTVSWGYGCNTAEDPVSFSKPLGDNGPSCKDIMLANFRNCE